MAADVLLELRGIQKRYGAVQVLHGVDLDVPAGKVTALVGDNGAGKSTLIKCVSGIVTIDGGSMHWEGRQVAVHSPKDASALGIETVYQDLALCDNLDIVQNMYLGRELTNYRMLDETAMERQAAETLEGLSVTTIASVRQRVAALSGGQRQSVAVAKAVMWNSKLVILDEPTAALGVQQTRQVLGLVKRLADRGLAVLMVSHNLVDVFEVAHRIAVLRLGRLAAVDDASNLDSQSVVELMTTGQAQGEVGRGQPTRGSGDGTPTQSQVVEESS
ncbi:MAG TPA: ATP-binding cassette domain-containing protein [Nocardioidaceae bacterium]|nr:ATP-binding cassette domain-containing protein [Nocardioidaceae bacterium]